MSVSIPLQTLFANTRAGTVYQTTSSGAIEAVSAETTCMAHWVGGKPHALLQPARTNRALHNRDLANAAWVKTNMTAARTSLGVDGAANSATRLTATAGNATVLQTITHASTARAMTAYIKRITGAGTIEMTMDNGATWTAVTATAAYTRVSIPTQTLADPVFGFRIVTSGDAIDVDVVQLEDGAFDTTAILTTSSAVTRAADNATCSVNTFPIDQNGGSIEIIGRAYYTTGGSGVPRLFQLDDGTENNRITLFASEPASALNLLVTVGGVAQANESIAYTSGDEFHAVLVFEEDNVFISLNGANSTPDTTASFPTGLMTTWRWAQQTGGASNTAAVLINRIASHSHEFSTTGADAITAA